MKTVILNNLYQGENPVPMAIRNGEIIYHRVVKPSYTPLPYDQQYLTFDIISGGTIGWKNFDDATPKQIEYSKDYGSTWIPITSTSAGTIFNVAAGDKIMFRGNNDAYGETGSKYTSFSSDGALFNISGNIMSLMYGDNFAGKNTFNDDTLSYIFANLFYGTGVVNASNLILPASALTDYCYSSMFNGCTSITSAPALPAMTLADRCYGNMFQGCASLASAPELPATALTSECYYYMFSNCRSLTTAPALPATTLAINCYCYMFHFCTGLTQAPVLPATALTNYCYQGMFILCTSLSQAPALPATTLTIGCYNQMFYYCTGLTSAPELPATTLTDYCYYGMFDNCRSLNYIKCLATDISALDCTTDWVSGVNGTGTFVKAASMTDWATGNNGIPTNWTVQDAS